MVLTQLVDHDLVDFTYRWQFNNS